MADGEGHGGPQFRGTWLADRSQPLPGTARHPQGRLFAPVGNPAGSPWKHSPENWMGQSETPSHSDIISWHASESSQLPRYDDPSYRQLDEYEHSGDDWDNSFLTDEGEENPDYVDHSIDVKGRPMADYGSAVGMHFGDIRAGGERPARDFIHPARIPQASLAQPPRGNFSTPRPGGSIAAGPYKSNMSIINSETGERTADWRWSDAAANFAHKATDLVESGKTIAYRNDVEAPGSTSYRTLPETTRTWSEDVMEQKTAHPSMRAAAEAGYNPVQRVADKPQHFSPMDVQLQFPLGTNFPDKQVRGTHGLSPSKTPGVMHSEIAEHNAKANAVDDRMAAFHRGRAWSLQKPTEQDRWD